MIQLDLDNSFHIEFGIRRVSSKYRERQTDRQTDRWTDRQTDRNYITPVVISVQANIRNM